MFKELIEGDIKNRGTIVPTSSISPVPTTTERYASLFSFDDNINSYVKVKNSVSGYGGRLYAEDLIIDIDCGDLEFARESAVRVVTYLNTEYNLHPDDIVYYFSGGKGFHLYMDAKLFGGIDGSQELAAQFKEFVSEIAEKVDNVDLKIYEPVRIFRLPNSTNKKTGLYKIEISFDELQNNTIQEIKDLARNPRLDFKRPRPKYTLARNNQLSIHWQAIVSRPSATDVDRHQLVTDDNFFAPPMEGERNSTLFKQASMLFDLTEGRMHRKAVMQLLKSVNFASGNPISDGELWTIVKHAEQKIERNGRIKPKEEITWKPVAEWIPTWESQVMDKSSSLITGFPSFDKVFKGKLRGKMVGLVGYGGSKKSMLGQQIINANIERSDAIALWNSAEMPAIQAIDRAIDQVVDFGPRHASDVIKDYYDSDIVTGKAAMHRDIAQYFGNKLLISENCRLAADNYRDAIMNCIRTNGRCDILLVDGLSMMDDKGTEVEAANRNSAELKELAKEFNILVLVIIHASKGGTKSTRDLEPHMRGSQKLADNLDAMIFMSMCEDLRSDDEKIAEGKNPKVIEYLPDKGYARLYDKRGSGITKDVIYNFNEYRLRLEESNDNPLWYERK